MKLNKKVNVLLWLDYVAFAIIVIVFFVISYCGFYYSDDITMAYGGVPAGFGERVGEISSIFDVFKLTWWWYFHWGGRIFSVAAQYFFCGLLGNKVWFDIVNTMFFMLLIIICGRLANNDNKKGIRYVLVFALLFWFLCPQPDETLFWVAGSTTHFWANTLAFVFLLFFLKYKDDNFSFVGKIGLLFLSIFAAAEFIPCISICGAFVVYYAIHFKRFKGNAVPLVVGFVIGSIIMLFAPGNFGRASEASFKLSFFVRLQDLIHHPFQEMVKYKALWMFLIILVCGWIKNKVIVKSWVKNNSFLLLSLGWSVIAFSVVFRPVMRGLFFTETLSLILFLRFLFDNYHVFEIRFLGGFMNNNSVVYRVIIVILFIVFLLDSGFAIAETKKQCKNNDDLLNKIANSNGVVVLDRMDSSHRMANATEWSVYEWTWEPLAYKFGLDSVHLYPSYCQDKYYTQAPPKENICIDETNYKKDNDVLGKHVRLIVRIKNEELQASNNHVTFTIDYTRPRKWYKSWLDKWRNYRYDRTDVVERDIPDICFNGYSYYMIFFGRENVKGLKSVKYTIE